MNPYDPNDALSDKSEEFISDEALATVNELTEEFPIDQVKIELGRMEAVITQMSNDSINGDFVSGEITSEDSMCVNTMFNDPNNEIDSGKDLKSREYSMGEEIKDVLRKYISEAEAETEEAADVLNTGESAEVVSESFPPKSNTESVPEVVSPDTDGKDVLEMKVSNDLMYLLEEAKTLFEPPEKPKVKIFERVISNESCPITYSETELQEIEAKLKEFHLIKSQQEKRDNRLNQPSSKEETCKPEETPLSELGTPSPTNASTLEAKPKVSFHPDIPLEPKTPKTFFFETEAPKCTHADDFAILSRAVQLLESRPSTQHIPASSRGLLGILALQKKLNELTNDKEELEVRLHKCNTDFMEFIDILTDKARIISINSKEVANFIKILNLKIPELEKVTASHTESLEDIKYRFKERNVAKIIELRKQIEFYTSNIEKLKKKVSKFKLDNVGIQREMENLDIDNLNYKSNFARKVEEVRANMDNLQAMNKELQSQLEMIQNSDLGKNENFKLKVPSLKEEIEIISNNIKIVRRDKNKYEFQNTELRKKLKQLILAKVLEKKTFEPNKSEPINSEPKTFVPKASEV